ncbi:MAG: hypothetical protein M3O29_07975 [Actinomycetota bacterium]|nr:hypothetical protein [Actinomycetota bacterium]
MAARSSKARWVAPLNGGPYYGYTGLGYTEEFWILDVEGSRLVVSTQRTPDMPAEDIAESRAILDSIRIEPRRGRNPSGTDWLTTPIAPVSPREISRLYPDGVQSK